MPVKRGIKAKCFLKSKDFWLAIVAIPATLGGMIATGLCAPLLLEIVMYIIVGLICVVLGFFVLMIVVIASIVESLVNCVRSIQDKDEWSIFE